jgi:hypothetical protein
MAHQSAMEAGQDFLPAALKERASVLAQQWRDFCSSRSAALVSFQAPARTCLGVKCFDHLLVAVC